MARVGALQADQQEQGVWMFAGGLAAPSTATTLRPGDDELLMVDRPFVEGKEYLGGITVIDVADLDAARVGSAHGGGDRTPHRGPTVRGVSSVADDPVTAAFRTQHGRAVAVLTRLLGDLDLAEEAVAEAFTAAVAT